MLPTHKKITRILRSGYLAEVRPTQAHGLLGPSGVSIQMAELDEALPVADAQRGIGISPHFQKVHGYPSLLRGISTLALGLIFSLLR